MLKHDFEDADGILNWHPTGSNYICNPPVTDTDIDFIILVDFLSEYRLRFANIGYKCTSNNEYYPEHDIETFRKGNVNLIVIEDAVTYGRWITATEIAKRLNLTDKQDRIDLFQGVLYGNYKSC